MSYPAEFDTFTVKLNVPAADGVPEIAPVEEFKLKPPGKLPLVICQVKGVVPVAASRPA